MELRNKIDKILGHTLSIIMGIMVLNVLWQVFTRFVVGTPSSFTDELARYLMIWVGGARSRLHLWTKNACSYRFVSYKIEQGRAGKIKNICQHTHHRILFGGFRSWWPSIGLYYV